MNDSIIRIAYPDHEEFVLATHLDGSRYRLNSHSFFIPLAPRDVVTADCGTMTGVEETMPTFTVEVYFYLDTDPDVVEARAVQWDEAAWATQSTRFSVLVTSGSRRWIDDVVASDPDVDWLDVIRVPEGAVMYADADNEEGW